MACSLDAGGPNVDIIFLPFENGAGRTSAPFWELYTALVAVFVINLLRCLVTNVLSERPPIIPANLSG